MTAQQPFDYEGEIWKIADFVWGPFKTSEFNRVIFPFTMLRRLDMPDLMQYLKKEKE